jgi:hypothetical protein
MSPDLDKALCRDFPSLYRDRHKSPSRTAMCWGFAVDDGWEPIIRRLSKRLEPFVVGTRVRCAQVKEKYGELCFYLDRPTPSDVILRAVEEAEKAAARTCEQCGAPGRRRPRRAWIQTLCDRCARSRATSKV